MKRILLAIDGSEGSRKAARFASDLARETRAQLIILTVLERPTMVPFGPLDAWAYGTRESEQQVAAVKKMMDEVTSALGDQVAAEKRVEFGVPAEVIGDQAEKSGAELIVVGSHGHSAAGRWLVGSVADRLVHHSKVPVTVVR